MAIYKKIIRHSLIVYFTILCNLSAFAESLPPQYTIEFRYGNQGQPLNPSPTYKRSIVHGSVSREQYDTIQRVMVSEGKEAVLRQSERFPILTIFGYPIPVGGWDYEETNTLVHVKAQREGKWIRLNLTLQREAMSRFGKSTIDSNAVSTDILCRPGEWTQIGGSDAESSPDISTTRVYQTGDRQLNKSFFYVRVENTK